MPRNDALVKAGAPTPRPRRETGALNECSRTLARDRSFHSIGRAANDVGAECTRMNRARSQSPGRLSKRLRLLDGLRARSWPGALYARPPRREPTRQCSLVRAPANARPALLPTNRAMKLCVRAGLS